MKLGATRSPKFRRLVRATGLSRVQAVGTLELLWLFTMEQAPAGDVGRWSDEDLEAELEWDGEPGALVEALVACGWLDRSETYRLVVHDWHDHLPDFLQRRVARKKLVLASGSPCQDDSDHGETCSDLSGQDTDKSGNVPVREGKGREGKPREGKRPTDDRSDDVRTDPDGAGAPAAAPPLAEADRDPPPDPTPLLNALSKLEGGLDEKRAWLEHEYPLIWAEARSDPTKNRILAITIRYYRAYLKGKREFRDWASKQETRRRMAEHDAAFAADMAAIEEAEGAAAHR